MQRSTSATALGALALGLGLLLGLAALPQPQLQRHPPAGASVRFPLETPRAEEGTAATPVEPASGAADVLLALAAAQERDDADAVARLVAELAALEPEALRRVLAALQSDDSLTHALALARQALPLLDVTRRALLLAWVEAALQREGSTEVCTEALRLLAELDGPRFQATVGRAARRPDAGLGLLQGVVATLELLDPAAESSVLRGMAAAQLAANDAQAPDGVQRQELAVGASTYLVRRTPTATRLRLLADPAVPRSERLAVALATVAADDLRQLTADDLAPLEGLLTEELEAGLDDVAAQGLTPSAERAQRALLETPHGAQALSAVLSDGALGRVAVIQVAQSVSRIQSPEAILASMRAAPAHSAARRNLALAFHLGRVAEDDPRHATYVDLVLESLGAATGAHQRDLLDLLAPHVADPRVHSTLEQLAQSASPLAARARDLLRP